MHKVYCVLTCYQDFEDRSMNEVVLNGVYASKDSALKCLCERFKEELELEMISLDFDYDLDKDYSDNYLLDNVSSEVDKFGYLSFGQHIGNGRVYVYLEEKEVRNN